MSNSNLPIYEMLAQAFASEGVDALFNLMGDGNMHWATAMSKIDGMQVFHARHEHCACGMAIGYYSATGKTGVASVTCGPGVTQIITALSTAVRARVPLVVFAGETPINAKWYNQAIEQAPLVTATGAHYVRAHSAKLMHEYVREAFYVARYERRPTVLGVPYDLQKLTFAGGDYKPSASYIPQPGRTPPNPDSVALLADKIANAKRPIVIAGRGAVASGARSAIEALAETAGALLATTLPGRGMFDASPFSIGVAGGFSGEGARELFADSDLVIAIGASLTYYTVDGGALFPKATAVQIDERPLGLRDGMQAAHLFIKADAKTGAEAVTQELQKRGIKNAGYRSPKIAERIATMPIDTTEFAIAPGTFDPRQVIAQLDGVIPKDWDLVSGSGHQAYFQTHMRGRKPENFHVLREFGAIGNSISIAMGVAAARKNGKVLLIEGDGSLIMHIQELETMRRHGIKLLICVLNDGAYGAEIHKLRQDGLDDSGAIFGRTDFGAIANGFGLRGTNVTDLGRLAAMLRDYEMQDSAEIWNVPISDQVTSPTMRRNKIKGHGVI